MTQYVINIGALPNDGTGDPLRTAFNEVNLNFNQVWATGLVGSNVQIANNTILTTNTNGNLVLNPNGIGNVVANAHVIPDQTRVRNLGSSTQKWNTIYSQYITISGDATIAGNLSVAGNVVEVGNIVTDSLTIQLGNTTSSANAANGAGITVGANDNIATMLYNSTGNVWSMNIGISAVGNVSAPYFIGNGSLLTGISTNSNKIFNGTSYANIATANGNVVISANGAGWTFDTTGTLTFPDNSGSDWPINQQRYGMGNIGAWLDGQWTIGEFSGNGVSGQVGIRIDPAIEGNTGITLPSQADSVSQQVQIYNTGGGGIGLYTGANNWTFAADGNLIFPNNASISSIGNITNFNTSANGFLGLNSFDAGGNNIARIAVDSIDGLVGIGTYDPATDSDYSWTFNNNGTTNFPTLSVDLHNGGVQTGQTLQFGDPSQQAFITGPAPAANVSAQRLIIQGQRGNGTGEGGDVYVWAGDADTNGGDIKIYAGDADNGSTGTGGYINIDGGSGFDSGGGITITGGQSSNGYGGAVNIYSGQGVQAGSIEIQPGYSSGAGAPGGNILLQGGYSQGNVGGTVTVRGGQSALGSADYGNVLVQAGASTWTFDNTGVLTVPQNINGSGALQLQGLANGNTTINIGSGVGGDIDMVSNLGNINLYTASNQPWTFDQGGDFTAPGAINVGNMSIGELPGYITAEANTGIILNVSGPDGGFVVDYLKEDGNANTSGGELAFNSELGNATYRISLSDDLGDGFATKIWRFDGTGNITLPGGGSVYSEGFTPSGNPGNTIVLNPHGSGSITNQKLMLYPTAADGDHLHMTTGNLYQTELFLGSDDFYVKLSNTGNVVINSNDGVGNTAQWTFETNGNLTVPGNLNGSGASPAPSINGFDSINAVTISASGNITGNYLIGNGSQLTGLPASYGNSNVADFMSNYGSNTISLSGTITAGNTYVNGVLSTTGNITGANVIGDSFYANGLISASGNIDAREFHGSLFGNTVSNITITPDTHLQFNVGTIANVVYINDGGMIVDGGVNGYISASGNINGANINAVGDIHGGNIHTDGKVSAAGAIFGANAVITDAVNANTVGANIFTGGTISMGGNIESNTWVTARFMGSTGNIRIYQGNLIVQTGYVSAVGNITGNYFIGNGSQLTGLPAGYGNANLANIGSNTISTTGNISSGNSIITGNTSTGVYALDVGVSAAFLSNTVASFTSNVNNYTQLTLQNLSTGADATTDYILTADNGSDTVNYSDFGIINSGYDNGTPTNSLGNIVYAADTYIYAQGNISNTSQSGGNLAIGTTTAGKSVKIFAGGNTASALIANISNTGISVAGNVTASNFIGNISITGNVTGTSSNVSLVAGSYTWTFDNTSVLTLPTGSNGNEGAEIDFTKAANSTLSGNTVVIDQYVDKLRFFESGGNTRGAYIDLSQAGVGVTTLLNNRVSAANLALNTSLTFDNLAVQIKTQSLGVWIFLATVSGTATYQYAITYQLGGGGLSNPQGTTGTMSANTTPATVGINSWYFSVAGYQATTTVTDTTNNKMYRVTWMTTTGSSPYGNFVSIERLV